MIICGVDLSQYRTGDVVYFRRPGRFEVNYSSFLRFDHLTDEPIPFVVGVSTLEWLEAEMRRRVYRPMIETRFDPARLPA